MMNMKEAIFAVSLVILLIFSEFGFVMSSSTQESATVQSYGKVLYTKRFRVGVNYLSLYYMYSNTYTANDTLRRDFNNFQQDGIDTISLCLPWYRLEGDTRGSYDGVYADKTPYGRRVLDNIKRIVQIAKEYDIKVIFTIHTLWGPDDSPWCTPDYVIDPISNKNIGLAVVRSEEMKQAFVDMFNYTVQYLVDTPGIYAFALLNEPWYWGRTASEHDFITSNGKTQKENFIEIIQEMSNMVDQYYGCKKTIRFICSLFQRDWNWDQRIFDALDFISFNAYPSPALGNSYLDLIRNNVEGCIQRNKQVWITEFGYATSDDLEQQQVYRYAVSFFKTLPIEGYIAWFWRGDSSISNPGSLGSGYNLCKNIEGEPRPAYYDLI